MNRSIIRLTAITQIGITILTCLGCAPTQPFFLNESPDLQHYLNTATAIEYPDVNVDSLAETLEALPPLTVNNHDYQFWDLSLEDCVSMALTNAKFLHTTNGLAEQRQAFAEQFVAANPDQFGSVYDIAIQQSTTQSIPLTIDGAGNRVLPRGATRANQVGGVEDALAEFDAQTSAFIDYNKSDRANNVLPGNVFNPVFAIADNVTQQSAISKRFATGGVATLRQQIVYSSNNTLAPSIARAVPSDWTAVLEAQIQHPLMRNRGTLVNRIPVVLASLNEDITIAEFELQVRNLVRDVEVAYWDLYVAYRAFASVAVGRNSAQVTADFAQQNLKEGFGTIQDVQQAKGQYQAFRSQLIGSLTGSNLQGQDRFGVYGRERRMRELLGLTATDGRLIRPIDEPTIARVEHDWYESLAQSLYLNAELRQTKFRIKQSELELMAAKNQILPELNLSLLYRWVGRGDTLGPPGRRDVDFPSEGSSALGELTGGNFQEGGIRLELTPPAVGARRELARINGAEWRLVRETANLQEKERLLTFLLSDSIAKTSTHFQQVQVTAQQWQAAEIEVEARLAELRNGRGDTNVVLQSQQRRAEAEIAYYRALGEYNKSLNYVDYLKGTLLVNNGITLSEGPWHTKAYQDALERARERSAGRELQYGVTRPGVVRRGPVGDQAAALQQIDGPTAGSHGAIQTPDQMTPMTGIPSDAMPLNQPIGDSLQPIDMGRYQRPLSEMGDSPADALNVAEPIGTPAPMGTPAPIDRLQSIPGNAPADAGRSILTPPAGSSGVEPISYTTHHSGAPEPVRRVPIDR